ncbi:protein phosphatase 1 regulatory subunit 42 [Verrucomicrobia bacterium]|nr:protein phosphatase 1 regulatory subunit 42 [Verrucomicrobiota bacterium]
MKQILLMIAVVALVGCGKKEATSKVVPEKLIADPIVEKAVREVFYKPTGEFTKADLEKLEVLKLRNNQLTELPNGLEKFTQLYALVLSHNQLTSVKGLEKLTQLTKLVLSNNHLTDVKGLEKLTQLTELWLTGNQLTSVDGLEKLTQLKMLWLSGNQLTDVKGLEKLTQLTELSLQDNQLTDVKHLEKLTQLKELWLSDNQLTKAQIDQLQKALPNCKIYSNPTK